MSHPRCFNLVLHVAAYKLYPVRVRVLDAITGHDEWLDIAYIPQVTTERGSAGAERSRLRRIMVLQRMLYLTFRSLISASHIGVPVPGGEHGTLLAFPRLLLYICDQPEERAVLCLKPGMCFRPCWNYDVLLSDLGTPAELLAGEKHALTTILRHLEVHGHHAHAREKQRRDHLEKTLRINEYPPVLAAMAGLGTPPFLLYKIMALDVLHVSLTVTTVVLARFLVAQTVRDFCGLFRLRDLTMDLYTSLCKCSCTPFSNALPFTGFGPGDHAAARPPPGAHFPEHVWRPSPAVW